MAMDVDTSEDFLSDSMKQNQLPKRVFGQELTNRVYRVHPVHKDCGKRKGTPFVKPSHGCRQFVAQEATQWEEEEEVDVNVDAVPEWDRDDVEAHTECREYIGDIMEQLWETEQNRERERSVDFMRHQPDVNGKMRALLVEWLLDVHLKFEFSTCVIHTAVAILDKFLRRENVERHNLQLFGLSSLWIATKYHERFNFTIPELQSLHDRSRDEYIEAERRIVSSLHFELSQVTAHTFAQRFIQIVRFGLEAIQANFVEHFINYLLDLALCHYKLSLQTPSRIAAGAVTFVSLVTKFKPWNQSLEYELGYSLQSLKPVMIIFANILNDEARYAPVRRKYSKRRFAKVELLLQQMRPVNLELFLPRVDEDISKLQSGCRSEPQISG